MIVMPKMSEKKKKLLKEAKERPPVEPTRAAKANRTKKGKEWNVRKKEIPEGCETNASCWAYKKSQTKRLGRWSQWLRNHLRKKRRNHVARKAHLTNPPERRATGNRLQLENDTNGIRSNSRYPCRVLHNLHSIDSWWKGSRFPNWQYNS